MNIREAKAVLERAKQEHERGGYEGLDCCDSLIGNGPHDCSCGADKTNAELDEVIVWLDEVGQATKEMIQPFSLMLPIDLNLL